MIVNLEQRGPAGKDASINGVNTLEIVAGNNVEIKQEGSTLIISALGGGVPEGTIIMWYGSDQDIPKGWALCDGENGTPDLRDKFVLAAGGKYSPGDAGGSETVTLSLNQMPQHSHPIVSRSSATGFGYYAYPALASNTGKSATINTSYTGSSEPHNNMPPYYALYYIMRVS